MLSKILLIWLYYNYYNNRRPTNIANEFRPRPIVSEFEPETAPNAKNDYLIENGNQFWSDTSAPAAHDFLVAEPIIEPILPAGGMVGNLGPTTTLHNIELSQAIENLTLEINRQAGLEAQSFHLVSYKSQIVAGINYFCKLRIDYLDQFLHVRIHRTFGGEYQLHGVELNHASDDEIAYF